jgi:hypothetical protein
VNLSEHNWIWGIQITQNMILVSGYPTCSSWLSSFSANSYTAGAGCYAMINSMLYNKIPATDVRKGWWVDENLHSPLLESISWNGASGDDLAKLEIDDVKLAFTPYTNVKFGMKDGIGSENNINDYPLMRAEEMILIQAEGLAKSGNEAQARQILESFVKTYRDPSYDSNASGRSLADEIWYQRRVELWGEGFAFGDIMRLQKPIIRSNSVNWPTSWIQDIEAGNGVLLWRIPQAEIESNKGISEADNNPFVAL